MSKISGFTCVRNAKDLDYCVEQTIQSLLPISDEVVVSDGESTDGTKEWLDDWAKKEPKLNIVTYPWPDFRDRPDYWLKWLNHTRGFLRHEIQLSIDADEVLHPKSYPDILEAAKYDWALWFRRENFLKDAQHTSPDGCLVGHLVCRLGPTWMETVSDEPREVEPEIRVLAGLPPKTPENCRILHYGFLRKNYFHKARVVLELAAGTMDQRLVRAEAAGKPWYDEFDFQDSTGKPRELGQYKEPHPNIMHDWLRERGYNPTP